MRAKFVKFDRSLTGFLFVEAAFWRDHRPKKINGNAKLKITATQKRISSKGEEKSGDATDSGSRYIRIGR